MGHIRLFEPSNLLELTLKLHGDSKYTLPMSHSYYERLNYGVYRANLQPRTRISISPVRPIIPCCSPIVNPLYVLFPLTTSIHLIQHRFNRRQLNKTHTMHLISRLLITYPRPVALGIRISIHLCQRRLSVMPSFYKPSDKSYCSSEPDDRSERDPGYGAVAEGACRRGHRIAGTEFRLAARSTVA